MKYNQLMHIAVYTEHMDEMIDFYCKKLGCKLTSIVRNKIYLGREDRPQMQEIAKKDPEGIFNVYIEFAPLQFIELFPAKAGQKPHPARDEHIGYSHFALTVDDIFAAREELEKQGIVFDTQISKGPSETYQMWTHDPDGNYIEVMQFTENSIQLKGMVD